VLVLAQNGTSGYVGPQELGMAKKPGRKVVHIRDKKRSSFTECGWPTERRTVLPKMDFDGLAAWCRGYQDSLRKQGSDKVCEPCTLCFTVSELEILANLNI